MSNLVWKDTPIDFSSFDGTAANSLRRWDIFTNEVLITCSESDMREIPHFGEMRVAHVKAYLQKLGLRLRSPNETFPDRAAEVYGDLSLTSIAALMVQLRIPLESDVHFLSSSDYGRLKKCGLFVIGDFDRFTSAQIRSLLGYDPNPLYYSLRGWLTCAGIRLAGK